jgi:hypothetical protein
MSELAQQHDQIVQEHHSVTQELIGLVRGNNSALEQAKAQAVAAEEALVEASGKRDELLTYLKEMTAFVRSELDSAKAQVGA